MPIKIIFFSILDTLVSQVIARLLVNWWAPLFAYDGVANDKGRAIKGPRLPNWLAWFDTFDATLDAGLQNGEASSFATRRRWLNRNPAYGFSYWVLGEPFDRTQWETVAYTAHPLYFEATGPDGQYNRIRIWHGIKIKTGWKAWNYFIVDENGTRSWERRPWGVEMRVPFVFSVSIAHEDEK